MFEEETRRALDYVARGISVRIVGATGSGRSTVAKGIIAQLEKGGAEVYSLFGARLLRQSPLAGISTLALEMRARHTGPLGLADALAEQLAQRGSRIIVVDDIDLLDNESLAVIDIAQKRSQRPLVMTMDDSPIYPRNPVFSPERWPEAHIRLGPLRYDQVNKLVTQTLAAPADVDTTAHILMKSAGNPRLVVRMAQSGVLNKLLALSDGQWRMAGHTLWTPDLQGTVEALFHGLGPNELNALHTLSVLGTRTMKCLQTVVDASMLDRLEARGLVAVSEDVNGEICVAANPPLLVDYFRDRHMLSARRVLASRIENAVEMLSRPPEEGRHLTPSVAAVVGQLREEAGAGETLTGIHFQEQLREREEAHYALWESEPNMANASAFLKFYWGGPIDAGRIEKVFRRTSTAGARPEHHLVFAMTRALWSIVKGEETSVGAVILADYASIHPEWAPEAEAFALFLSASYDQMPDNPDAMFDELGKGHSNTGVLSVVRGMLEVYRFDGQSALKALDEADGFELAANIEPFVRGLALLVAGRLDEALVFSLNQRNISRRALDQFGFIANSYVAAMALTQRGFGLEADYMMSSVFALGRPGFLANSLHDAMLRLAGLRALTGSGKKISSLGTQARGDVADIGPLPGTGKGVFNLFAQRYGDPKAFDDKATELIEGQLSRGYVMEAAYTAVFTLCLLPSGEVLERAERLFKSKRVASHNQFLAIAAAVVENDYQLVGILLDQYEPDADLHAVSLLLTSASKRRLLERDKSSASSFQQLARAFDSRFPTPGPHVTLNIGTEQAQPLSSREAEVAILAGSHTNTEISARLRISLRTVENHISRALKKTGTNSRRSLYEHVRGSRNSQ